MMTIEQAVDLAAEWHEGQVDKAQQPYIFHLMRVATSVLPKYAIPAILHDILEDTAIGHRELSRVGVSLVDVSTIIRLTWQNETYDEYIINIIESGDQAALEIKMEDLNDHLFKNPNPLKRGKKADKYESALHRIEMEYLRRRRIAREPSDD